MLARTLAGLVALIPLVIADSQAPRSRQSDQAALAAYGGLVGPWKGTGLPRRGSNQGAWTESGSWAWKLSADSASLALDVAKGKYLRSALLRPGDDPGSFRLDATLADGTAHSFFGRPAAADKPLVLIDPTPSADGPARITLTPLHENRFLLLLEARDDASYRRLAEVGYTRQGVAFAAGESGPVCIVTGGRGTIQVSHAGKAYWVCCSGCKDLFHDDPAGVLADADRRAAAGKAK